MRTALFRIRPYHPRDLDQLASAVNRSIRAAYAFFGYPHPASVTRQRLRDALAQGQEFHVAEGNGVAVGLLALEPNYLDKLFIAPEWQGKGVGAALIGEAKRLNPSGLELDCFQENRAALRLYERHGFRPIAYRWHKEPDIPNIICRWEGSTGRSRSPPQS